MHRRVSKGRNPTRQQFRAQAQQGQRFEGEYLPPCRADKALKATQRLQKEVDATQKKHAESREVDSKNREML